MKKKKKFGNVINVKKIIGHVVLVFCILIFSIETFSNDNINKVYTINVEVDYGFATSYAIMNSEGKIILRNTYYDDNDLVYIIYDFLTNEQLYLYRISNDLTKNYNYYLKEYYNNATPSDLSGYEEYLYDISNEEYCDYKYVCNFEKIERFYDLDGKEIKDNNVVSNIKKNLIRIKSGHQNTFYFQDTNSIMNKINNISDMRLNVNADSIIRKRWNLYFVEDDDFISIYDENYKFINKLENNKLYSLNNVLIRDENTKKSYITSNGMIDLRLKCKNKIYYLAINDRDDYSDEINYNLLDENFNSTNLKSFNLNFLYLLRADGANFYVLSGLGNGLEGTIELHDDTIYLKNSVYNVNILGENVEYDFFNNKIVQDDVADRIDNIDLDSDDYLNSENKKTENAIDNSFDKEVYINGEWCNLYVQNIDYDIYENGFEYIFTDKNVNEIFRISKFSLGEFE